MTTLTTPNSRDLDRARAMARVLDTAVGIPGTPLRIGLDAVLGVIPGAGDLIAAGLSGYIILTAQRAGAPPAVLWRMLGNVIIDTAIGSIPVLGDLFDVAFKSNAKNVALLERYTVEPGRVTASSRRMGVLVLVAVGLALVGAVAAGFFVARALWRLLTG